jgi:hypothetical protein
VGDKTKRVECKVHGEGHATFVCHHLRTGVACGYVASEEPKDDDPCPDAWCSTCEEVRAAEGEWNDTSEGFAQVSLACSGCYQDARARNEALPPPLDRAAGRLSEDQVGRLIEVASASTDAAQKALDGRTHFLGYPEWFFDSDGATLRFQGCDAPTLASPVSLVGSFSTKTNTWMWSWENEGLDERAMGDVWRLRTFGEARDISRLATGYWAAEEVDGWEMTSVAAYLLGAQGVYRAPMDHQMWFMLMHDLRAVQ